MLNMLKLALLFAVIACSLSSCAEREFIEPTTQITLTGKWHLLLPTMGPLPNRSNTTWTFNTNHTTVDIRTSNDFQPVIPDGSYFYTVNGNEIIINNNQYAYSFDNDYLTVNGVAIFERD